MRGRHASVLQTGARERLERRNDKQLRDLYAAAQGYWHTHLPFAPVPRSSTRLENCP